VAAPVDLRSAKRILVYGVTGSGKSTLAARIGAATGLPWYSVDDLTFEPGWVEVPLDEQRRRIARICAQDEWVLDTAYGKWLDVPLPRVDLVVGLDYPRWRSYGRLCRRTLIRVIDKKTICNGNRETWRNVLRSDSILVWHFRSFHKKRKRIRSWAADPDGPAVQWIRSPGDLRRAMPELTGQEPGAASLAP
jgi:adenylate kinase family enzyme